MNAKPRIAVLGGGFGGLESTFYLKYKRAQTHRRPAGLRVWLVSTD